MIAFILILAKPGNKNKVYEKLKGHPMVKEVHKVFGEYDVIAKLEVEDISELDEFYEKVLKWIEGIVVTETLIARGSADD